MLPAATSSAVLIECTETYYDQLAAVLQILFAKVVFLS